MVGVALVGVVTWLLINPKSYEETFVRVENTGAEAGIVGDSAGGAGSAAHPDSPAGGSHEGRAKQSLQSHWRQKSCRRIILN